MNVVNYERTPGCNRRTPESDKRTLPHKQVDRFISQGNITGQASHDQAMPSRARPLPAYDVLIYPADRPAAVESCQ